MRLKLSESKGFFYRPIRAHRIKICACRFNIRANLMRTNLKAILIRVYRIKICARCFNMRAFCIKIRADLACTNLKVVRTIEEPFIFKFEYDKIYIFLIKGKMGIL